MKSFLTLTPFRLCLLLLSVGYNVFRSFLCFCLTLFNVKGSAITISLKIHPEKELCSSDCKSVRNVPSAPPSYHVIWSHHTVLDQQSVQQCSSLSLQKPSWTIMAMFSRQLSPFSVCQKTFLHSTKPLVFVCSHSVSLYFFFPCHCFEKSRNGEVKALCRLWTLHNEFECRALCPTHNGWWHGESVCRYKNPNQQPRTLPHKHGYNLRCLFQGPHILPALECSTHFVNFFWFCFSVQFHTCIVPYFPHCRAVQLCRHTLTESSVFKLFPLISCTKISGKRKQSLTH